MSASEYSEGDFSRPLEEMVLFYAEVGVWQLIYTSWLEKLVELFIGLIISSMDD